MKVYSLTAKVFTQRILTVNLYITLQTTALRSLSVSLIIKRVYPTTDISDFIIIFTKKNEKHLPMMPCQTNSHI